MGGLISIYAALKYPNIFSRVGAFSTATWFAEKELLQTLRDFNYKLPVKWYLDIGTKETSNNSKDHFNKLYLEGTKNIYNVLKEHVADDNLMLVIEENGIHNERDWSRRFPKAIESLLNK